MRVETQEYVKAVMASELTSSLNETNRLFGNPIRCYDQEHFLNSKVIILRGMLNPDEKTTAHRFFAIRTLLQTITQPDNSHTMRRKLKALGYEGKAATVKSLRETVAQIEQEMMTEYF